MKAPRSMGFVRWDGELPEPGDLLQYDSGTTYLVLDVRPGRVRPFTATVQRLTSAERDEAVAEPDATVWACSWVARR